MPDAGRQTTRPRWAVPPWLALTGFAVATVNLSNADGYGGGLLALACMAVLSRKVMHRG